MKAENSSKACTLALVWLLTLLSPGAAAAEKELVGTVTGVLKEGEEKLKVFVTDRNEVGNTIFATSQTAVKKQIEPSEIQSGDFAAVIFEEEAGNLVALSALLGTQEEIETSRAEEELFRFAPTPEAPKAPDLPETPDLPPVPGEETPSGGGGAAMPQGAGPAQPEATGFTPEEAKKAKEGSKPKHPLDDVLYDAGPLSDAGQEPPVPSFVTGKILSIESSLESAVLTLQDKDGKQVKMALRPDAYVMNRVANSSELTEGNRVSIVYEEAGEEKQAKSILIAKARPTALA
jgi:hypothetical protein